MNRRILFKALAIAPLAWLVPKATPTIKKRVTTVEAHQIPDWVLGGIQEHAYREVLEQCDRQTLIKIFHTRDLPNRLTLAALEQMHKNNAAGKWD